MWYNRVTQDVANIPDFIAYYEAELLSAKQECQISGSVERSVSRLPGITEHRFNQLQEIEAVLNYLNIQLRRVKKQQFQKFLENYNRALSSRDAEKYAEGTDEVCDYETLINEVALIRNRYLGIMKGLESRQWMSGHLIRLKTSGMEDYSV